MADSGQERNTESLRLIRSLGRQRRTSAQNSLMGVTPSPNNRSNFGESLRRRFTNFGLKPKGCCRRSDFGEMLGADPQWRAICDEQPQAEPALLRFALALETVRHQRRRFE